jgi:hypothetical protein
VIREMAMKADARAVVLTLRDAYKRRTGGLLREGREEDFLLITGLACRERRDWS